MSVWDKLLRLTSHELELARAESVRLTHRAQALQETGTALRVAIAETPHSDAAEFREYGNGVTQAQAALQHNASKRELADVELREAAIAQRRAERMVEKIRERAKHRRERRERNESDSGALISWLRERKDR